MKNCLRCGKELKIKESKKRINPKRKFCNETCKTRYNANKDYHTKNKFSKKFKEKQKIKFGRWYENNKERQKKNVLLDYYRNKDKWVERKYVGWHRKKFLELLPKRCINCGKKEVRIIAHTKWDFPKRKQGPTIKEHKKYLKWYSQFLLPFCCRKCRIDYFKNQSHHTIEGRSVQVLED